MNPSRRKFVVDAAVLGATGGTLLASGAGAVENSHPGEEDLTAVYQVVPIGKVEKDDSATRIRIFDKYADGLLGLDQWSHVNVFYWFDQNDTPEQRSILQVHPRGNAANPLTGVFACRAPMRPNLIALTVCRILSVEKNVITIDQIDAFDATPVIDLKPLIPADEASGKIKVPEWARKG
jgi:tRNA (adenine37-N6)-methyltransferase